MRISDLGAGKRPENTGYGPTPEFLSHHEVNPPEVTRKTRREAWQVNPRFESLDPDDAMRDAAHRWRRDYDVGMEGIREKNILLRVGWSPYGNHYSDHQIDAISRLIACRNAIKSYSAMLIQLCLTEDRDWSVLARNLGFKDRQTVKNHTRAAFVILRDYCEARNAIMTPDHDGLPDPPERLTENPTKPTDSSRGRNCARGS